MKVQKLYEFVMSTLLGEEALKAERIARSGKKLSQRYG